MRMGRFEEAWNISDRILRDRAGVACWHRPRHEQYLWTGEPLADKRVLVRCYHGLGDTVQFIRFVPQLKAIARETIVWAQSELIPLLRTANGIDRLLPVHDGSPACEYDVDVELMELPHAFRTTLDELPRAVPYFHLPTVHGECHHGARVNAQAAVDVPMHFRRGDSAGNAAREPSDANPLRVGVVWQSGGWDDRRSVPIALIEHLSRLPGVHLTALQQGAALGEWRAEWGDVGSTSDVLTLARRMQSLDLMISVDSFPAHLAGALAVPTWTLLHSDPDWRWMLGRDDTPWYPTMRLWRQERPGEWGPVIERVAMALQDLVGRARPSQIERRQD